jgi:sec-independent protein translocase protein TatC
VAITAPRRRNQNPDGRMPLGEHFRELRRRVVIGLGAFAGWFLYGPLYEALQEPILDASREKGLEAQVNFPDMTSAFNLHVKLAVYIGIVIASPVWLYEIWAFITPGLTRKERRTSIAFVSAAVPMFLGGIALAWLILPHAVRILFDFTPVGGSNIISADSYLSFTTRLCLAFGVAFVIPLLLIALNMVGILSGAALGRQWRISVFMIFLFVAIASPSPDVGVMLAMALPLVGLYLLTVGFCLLNDRRRARRRNDDPVFGLDDDESSPLEGSAGGVLASGPVERPAPLDRLDDDAT